MELEERKDKLRDIDLAFKLNNVKNARVQFYWTVGRYLYKRFKTRPVLKAIKSSKIEVFLIEWFYKLDLSVMGRKKHFINN
ncbi:MAG: hypothetical protein ACEPOZ_03675 [Marinifilaceae bacterium]